MPGIAQKTVKVFVSYSHEDKAYLEKLKRSLSALRKRKVIQAWYDGEIVPGQEWERRIYENLNGSDIILLLVSPDFVDSDYAYEEEMIRAMERHDRHEACVIPVIVRRTWGWEEAPFGKLQALPSGAEPVLSPAWPSEDDAWYDVVEGIATSVQTLLSEREREPARGHDRGVSQTPLEEAELPSIESDVDYGTGNGWGDTAQPSESIEAINQKIVDGQKQRGNYLAKQGLYKEAINAYEEALKLVPNYLEAWFNKGLVLGRLGRFEEAVEAFEEALTLTPNDPKTWYLKAVALGRLGRSEEEREAYEEAFNKDALI